MEEPVDVELLRRALETVCHAHPSLYMEYEQQASGEVIQRYVEMKPTELEEIALATGDKEAQHRELNLIADRIQCSLSLDQGVLFRVAWIRGFTDGTSRLLWVIHHLAVDGISWRILLEELTQAYEQGLRGEELSIPFETNTYKDWSLVLGEEVKRLESGEEKEFWLKQAMAPRLPVEGPGGDNRLGTSKTMECVLLNKKRARY